jgi:hypothetical protein
VSSSVHLNPGPGSYKEQSDWSPRAKRQAKESYKPVLERIEKTTPSIPQTKLLPGQQMGPDRDADLVQLIMRHTGQNGDTAGPGEYDPKGDGIVGPSAPATMFHGGEKGRKLWDHSSTSKQPPRENPGPGSYELARGLADNGRARAGVEENEAAGTYPFTSATALPHQQVVAEDAKVGPGPGEYEVFGQLDQTAKASRNKGQQAGYRSQFGSVTERTGWARAVDQPFKDPYHLHNVPGPGHYAAHGKDPRKKDAEKALPRNHTKQINGVHHPALVMALQDVQGPLQAFCSTDDRPCNRPLVQRTPAPWHYNKEEASGTSIQYTMKERAKIGKRGAFGTCADRFFNSPFAGKEGMPDPGMDMVMDEHGSGANAEPRSMFQSQTQRGQKPGTVAEGPLAPTVQVGTFQTPAPGAYDIMNEPSYRSPFRHPRQEHLSFGSGQRRFEGSRDLFQESTSLNPAPGAYDPGLPESQRQVKGGAAVKALRRPLLVGCTTEQVGPGSYDGAQPYTAMLKKTFNVTTQAPVMPASARGPNRRLFRHSMSDA